MSRYLLLIVLGLSHLSVLADNTIGDLLRLNRDIRSDSIIQWYKQNVRDLDSASAMRILNDVERIAVANNNDIGIATAYCIKGQYFDIKLRNNKEAIYYTRKAADYAEAKSLDPEWAKFTFQLGLIYFFNDKIPLSIECLLRADDKFRELGYEHDKYRAMHLYSIGYVYYHLHNYRESLKYLHEAAADNYDELWISRQLPNTMGLDYCELGIYDSAFMYFNKTLSLANADKDTLWSGIASGNIGQVFIKMNEYDKALPYLEKNYRAIRQQKGDGITGTMIWVLTAMAEVYVAKSEPGKALALLKEAQSLWPGTEKTDYWRQAYLFEIFSKAFALQGDFPAAYHYLQMSRGVSDSITRRDNALRYTYVQQQLQSEKHIARLNLIKARQKAMTQRRRFLLSAVALLGIIGWLLYTRRRLKIKKDLEIRDKKEQLLVSEHLRMEEDLEYAQKLLTQYMANITEKNSLIETFREQLEKSAGEGPEVSPQHIEYVQQLTASTLLTDEEWDRFRKLFEKVYTGFFGRLLQKVPGLTEAEIRLLALIKLNISNKHMAQMLGISPASVHTARYRLRKKIALPDDVPLEEILTGV